MPIKAQLVKQLHKTRIDLFQILTYFPT